MGFRDSERFRKTYSYFRPRPRPTDTFDAQETIRGIDWKQSVRIASTTNVDVTLAISPGSITTIDSGAGALTLADEDRILLKDQTSAAENGIYIWHASDYKLVRALDAIQDTLTSGAACYVEEGTHAQQVWFLTTVDPITVDSTNQVWSQIFGGLTGDDFFDSTTAGSIFTTGSAAFKGGESIDSPSDKGSDVFFYVSGSLNGASSSLFGGRLKASGSITSLLGLSGSLTKLADGTSYLIAGSNITIVSSSNGAVTISSTASGGGGGGDSYFSSSYTGSIFTTGSVAFRGIENISSSYQKGSDVFFYVSGSISGSGANDQKAIFGGDVRISGSLSQGFNTLASGIYSHAQGRSTKASGQYSHSEGYLTTGSNLYSHAEGERTSASGASSHAEGYLSVASGGNSHAEGAQTIASGLSSHAEGYQTTATSNYSHAEGRLTIAAQEYSHAEGMNATTAGVGSHAEGFYTSAVASFSHVEGHQTTGSAAYSHAEGYSSKTGARLYPALGVSPGSNVVFQILPFGYSLVGSFNIGSTLVIATDGDAPVEIATITGKSYDAFLDITSITASYYSFDSAGNGYNNYIFDLVKPNQGDASSSEDLSLTLSYYAHAEGIDTFAFGSGSHTEGYQTKTLGPHSHAEGEGTLALGISSHAEGTGSIAIGNYSHTEGYYTIASGAYQHVQGTYNKRDNATSLFVIGDGTGDSNANRSDILRVNPGASGGQGSLQLTGSLYVSGTSTFDSQGRSVSQIGADVYFFVSGSSGSLGTSTRGVAAFGGDVIVSGSLKVGTGSVTITSNDVQFGGVNTRIEKSSSDLKFYDSSNPSGVTLSSLAAGAGAPNYWTSPSNGLVNTTGSVSIQGDLTVNGTTVTVNTTNLEVKDAVIGLGFSSGTIAQTAGDRGFIAGLSGADNATLLWKNTSSEFVVGRTTSSSTGSLPIALTSYANFRAANIQANIVTASLGFSGSHTKLADGTSFIIAGNNLSVTSASNGAITIGTTIPQGGIVTASYFESATNGAIFTTGSAAFRGSENITSPSSKGSDVFFYVSGSLNGTNRSLFGGDVRVSGSVNTNLLTASNANITTLVNTTATSSYFTVTNEFVLATNVLEITGNLFVTNTMSSSFVTGTYIRSQDVRANTLTGSLTKLFDGTSYLIAGNNLSITTGSNGSVTIGTTATQGSIVTASYFDSTVAGSIFTTGSAAFRGSENISSPSSKGTDVFFYVSGSLAGTNKSLFGGFVTVSGTMSASVGQFSQLTSSFFRVTDSFVSSADQLEITGTLVVTGSARVTGSLYATGASTFDSQGRSTSQIGSDVFFFVSGSISGSGANDKRAVFGGDVRISGSLSQGILTIASGTYSHAEGERTLAAGRVSHAEGSGSIATAVGSHAEGFYTIASGSYQHVGGKYNKRGNDFSLFVIGDGTGDSDANRSDVLRVNSGSVGGTGRVEVTGSLAATLGLSGSLTKLVDGTSYLVAGSGIQITTGSNGAVTITNDGTVGDITAVTAGTGLTGGGTSGAVSLAINDSIVATVSGTTFTGATKHNAGLSGSLTRLTDGTSYLVAGTGIQITTASNGSVLITATGGGGGGGNSAYGLNFTNGNLTAGVLTVNHNLNSQYVNVTVFDNTDVQIIPDSVTATSTNASAVDLTSFGTLAGTWHLTVLASGSSGVGGGGGDSFFSSTTAGSIFTTGSAAFRGGASSIDSPSDVGSDVFFFVSGSSAGSGANDKKTVFGGDIKTSGSYLLNVVSGTSSPTYNVNPGDHFVVFTTNNVTGVLPPAALVGTQITFKDGTGIAGTSGGQMISSSAGKIDGSATHTMPSINYTSVTIIKIRTTPEEWLIM